MQTDYDLITVGGGIGGATLARWMAAAGARVLVLERTLKFQDRVRGEAIPSWGTAEAIALGVYDLLQGTCGVDLPWLDIFFGPEQVVHRDMRATTPQQTPFYTFPHPTAQEVLLEAAANAGAEVRRGDAVTRVLPGDPPAVALRGREAEETVSARLVVGADGRSAVSRRCAAFEVQRDPEHLVVCGVLFSAMTIPSDSARFHFHLESARLSLSFPRRNENVRAYIVYPSDAGFRLSGHKDLPRFVKEAVLAGAPREAFNGAKAIGPLASFDGADSWVPHPFHAGVALIGDAAATSDPTWGEGISLTLRDVRVLRDCLLQDDDWSRAGHHYAEEHDRHYGAVHQIDTWLSSLLLGQSPAAQARRARALPLLARDPSRLPDLFALGPETPVDDSVRRRLFGEE